MIGSWRRLVAVGVIFLAAVGCQKGTQAGAKGKGEAGAGGAGSKQSEASAGKTSGGESSTKETSTGKATESQASRQSRLTLTMPDHGKYLELRQGQVVTVVLPSNHSAGLSWSMAKAQGTAIVPDGKAAYSAPTTKGEEEGTETWRFRAAQPGEQTVRLEYGRGWQSIPEKTFSFRASVR